MDFFLTSLFSSLGQGLLYAPVAIGVFMSLRIMKRPDLTIEGTFAFGAVVAMTLLYNGFHFMVALAVAMLCGGIAGLTTSLIHTKLKIDSIISGLLVTMALFSVNLFVMGGNTVAAPLDRFIFTPVRNQLVAWQIDSLDALFLSHMIVGAATFILIIVCLFLLYNTLFGLSIRATGDNERMACSIGVNTDSRKIASLVISNGLTGLAGALVAQQQSGANVNSGVGVLITGLAALVIGEILTPKNVSIHVRFMFVALGALVYFGCITVVISTGLLSAEWTRMLTALLTLVALCVPKIRALIWESRPLPRKEVAR